MSELPDQQCVPCHGDVPPIEGSNVDEYLAELDSRWDVIDDHHLETDVEFDEYEAALDFIVAVTELAEEAGHHPEVCFTYRTVTVRVWTHAIDGLFDNDFILAARIDDHLDEVGVD
jgi:4a-hydroxytetrahydrobiopterin dehydratase